jgi:hypothetical protein
MSAKQKFTMPKIYISGKITGLENASELFAEAELLLAEMGLQPVNPMKLDHNHDRTWEDYMKHDIKAMCDCSMIYMLTNWTESRGAHIEHTLAQKIGMPVFYQADLINGNLNDY